MFCVNEASACGVFVDERRVTDERGGFDTVLTLAVREDLGGFQALAEERRVKLALGGISTISGNRKREYNQDSMRHSIKESASTVPKQVFALKA